MALFPSVHPSATKDIQTYLEASVHTLQTQCLLCFRIKTYWRLLADNSVLKDYLWWRAVWFCVLLQTLTSFLFKHFFPPWRHGHQLPSIKLWGINSLYNPFKQTHSSNCSFHVGWSTIFLPLVIFVVLFFSVSGQIGEMQLFCLIHVRDCR